MIFSNPGIKVCSSGEEAELLIPPHLDLEVYPEWLRRRALESNPGYKDAWPNSDSAAVSSLIENIDAWDWLDHWGTAVYAGKEFLVSEPYHMNREGIGQLLHFCDDTPEYWMYVHLSNQKKFFLQKGTLAIGLKQWQQGKVAVESGNSGRPPIENKAALGLTDNNHVTRNIHEANLESVVIEHLNKIEEGLELMESQRVCPGIGRIDLLCRDRYGDLVIVELKSFWAKQDSIVDQIGRYMGYVRSYLAKPGQNVRGIILVVKADEKLRHAVAGFPNLLLRELDLSIK